jgi:FHA domain
MPTCPDGHVTAAEDYCDVCGSPIGKPPPQPASSPPAGVPACPACQAPITGRFCEECGHDSAVPAPSPSAVQSVVWTAIVAADREFYERVLAGGGPDTVEFPEFCPERRITVRDNALIGRRNRDQGVEPEIDLGIHPVDRGVSTQHAVLRVRDSGLTVTDLGSTNGTSLNDSDDFLVNGEEIQLSDGDRVHVGAWTTITVVKSERRPGD